MFWFKHLVKRLECCSVLYQSRFLHLPKGMVECFSIRKIYQVGGGSFSGISKGASTGVFWYSRILSTLTIDFSSSATYLKIQAPVSQVRQLKRIS